MSPTNLRTPRTVVGTLIDLITSTLDNNGLTLLLLTEKPRYSVSVRPKKGFLSLLLILLPRVFVGPYLMFLDVIRSYF